MKLYLNSVILQNLSKAGSLIVANSNVELSFGTLHKTGNIVSTSIEFMFKQNLEISSSVDHILLFRIPNEFIPKISPRIFLFPMKVRTDVSSDNYVLELFVKNTGEISLGGFQGEKVSVLKTGLYFQSNGSWGV